MSGNHKAGDAPRATTGRGPAYPFIPLGKAVERAEQLRDANMARVAFGPLAVFKVWGFRGESGTARQTMAALNHFGLIEYVGRGDKREVRLTDLAHRVVFDKVPDSADRAAALREAALAPPIHTKLWDRYKHEPKLPPDVAIETFLMRDCRFNGSGAKSLISEFRDTLEYARLAEPDNMPLSARGDGAPDRGEEAVAAAHTAQAGKGDIGDTPPPQGTRREVFVLDEGDVVLTFPDNLSAASFADLEDHFELFLRKARRRAGVSAEARGGSDGGGAENGAASNSP